MSTILANTSALFLGFFLYLFFYWRVLKEDYLSNSIFASGIIIFLATITSGIFLGLTSTKLPESFIYNSQGLWFWGGVLGFLTSFFITQKKFKFKKYEHFQAASVPLLLIIFLVFILDFAVKANIYSLFGSLFIVGIFIIFLILENNYKKFIWYKSGKIGFSSLFAFAIFFLARVVIALFSLDVISSAGRIDVVFSGVSSFLLFFLVYHLSEN